MESCRGLWDGGGGGGGHTVFGAYIYHLKLMLVLVLALTSTSASVWSFLAYRMAASIVVRHAHFQNAVSLQPAGRSQLNFICSMSFVEDCLHNYAF